MIKRIHVNQHKIRENKKTGSNHPVLSVKTYKGNTLGNKVKILGESEVVYSPENPLSCGARVWVETSAIVIIDDTITIE